MIRSTVEQVSHAFKPRLVLLRGTPANHPPTVRSISLGSVLRSGKRNASCRLARGSCTRCEDLYLSLLLLADLRSLKSSSSMAPGDTQRSRRPTWATLESSTMPSKVRLLHGVIDTGVVELTGLLMSSSSPALPLHPPLGARPPHL